MNPVKHIFLVSILIAILTGQVIYGSQIPDQPVLKPAGKTDKPVRDTLKIGLLIPDKNALAAKDGAELALNETNDRSGSAGPYFQLIVRTTDGLWGAGSNESVSLVFEDHVLAYMGSLDGRNAHLGEQVATKTKVAFISAWATDMTLSYAFVPWFFRCIPDDKQQAASLIQEIYNDRKIKKVALIGTEAYDSRHAVNTFIKELNYNGIDNPDPLIYKASGQNIEAMLSNLKKSAIEAIVLFGPPDLASDIMPRLRQRGMSIPVFGTLSLLDDQRAHTPDWNILEHIIVVSSNQWFTKRGLSFQKKFQEVYGYQPGPVAAYTYDGMKMIIEAIKMAGADRDRIIDDLSKLKYTGITGEIRFDEKGNRSGNAGLMILRDGVPMPLEKDQ